MHRFNWLHEKSHWNKACAVEGNCEDQINLVLSKILCTNNGYELEVLN